MILKENTNSQKLRGAYYTPLTLAEKIVEYFKDDNSIKSVLEPSCGDGVFFDAIINQSLISKFTTVEGIEDRKSTRLNSSH